MIVSIHQPNYLPWLGFFDKIKQSDKFVIFDDVQFPRGKNHFGHRNLIKTPAGTKWLTIPVLNKSDFKKFNEIEINYNGWNEEHLRLINVFYNKSLYFNDYFGDIEKILITKYTNLCELNLTLIRYFMKHLDIDTEIVISSDISPSNIFGSEKIFYLLDNVGATKYITGSGPGSLRYIAETEFEMRNIQLQWQHYIHTPYTQLYDNNFIQYLSIIDLLFNQGKHSKNFI